MGSHYLQEPVPIETLTLREESMEEGNDKNVTYPIDTDTLDVSIYYCQKFQVALQPFVRYYMPAIVVVGLIGNLLSAWTFMGTRLRKLPSSHYLTALAVADSGMLLCHIMLMTGSVYPSIPGLCQITFYSGGVFSFLSVWYVVSFTLERYIAVRYPLKRLHWCTVHRARCIVLCVAIFACLFNSHILISVYPVLDMDNQTQCGIRHGFIEAANTMNHIDTALTFIIPLIFIVIWNTTIAITTICSKKSRRSMKISSKYPSANKGYRGSTDENSGTTLETFLDGESRRHTRRRVADDRKITRMLLIVSIVFLTMNLPDHLIRIAIYALISTNAWQNLSINQQCWIGACQKISSIIFNSNFAINFFLYSLVGANFRQHLKKLLKRIIIQVLERLDDVLPTRFKFRQSRLAVRLFSWLTNIDQDRTRFISSSNGYGAIGPTGAGGSLERFCSAPVSPMPFHHHHTSAGDIRSVSPSPRARHNERRMTTTTTISVKSTNHGHDLEIDRTLCRSDDHLLRSPLLNR